MCRKIHINLFLFTNPNCEEEEKNEKTTKAKRKEAALSIRFSSAVRDSKLTGSKLEWEIFASRMCPKQFFNVFMPEFLPFPPIDISFLARSICFSYLATCLKIISNLRTDRFSRELRTWKPGNAEDRVSFVCRPQSSLTEKKRGKSLKNIRPQNSQLNLISDIFQRAALFAICPGSIN